MGDDIKPEIIKRTQVTLGKYVKRPILTEKLLRKPPFRFLHDIITTVIKETKFLEGLYTAEELNPENIKDRNGKIAFLQKLIDIMSILTKSEIAAKPSKIVAGLEPTKTNQLLQSISKCLDKKVNSQDAVSIVNNTNKTAKSTNKSKSSKTSSSKDSPKEKPPVKIENKTKINESSKEKEKDQKPEPKEKTPVNQVEIEESSHPVSINDQTEPKSVENNTENHLPIEQERPNQEEQQQQQQQPPKEDKIPNETLRVESEMKRPQSAKHGKRRKSQISSVPLESVNNIKEQTDERSKTLIRQTTTVIDQTSTSSTVSAGESNLNQEIVIFGNGTNNNNNTTPIIEVPPRAKSARPMSSRPGAPRVREKVEAPLEDPSKTPLSKVNVITEKDIKEEDDEENFLVIDSQNIVSANENKEEENLNNNLEDHGRLVAQILETQKNLDDEKNRLLDSPQHQLGSKKVEIDWESGRKRNREMISREVEKLIESIQTVTRIANPLGKLMDFLQEDVESMHRELIDWQTSNVKLQEQLKEQEILTEQMVQPLKNQLDNLDVMIKDQTDQIKTVKSNILRNDERIKQLLNQGTT